MVGRVSGAELQDIAVAGWREADFVVGKACVSAVTSIDPNEADSLGASTDYKKYCCNFFIL